MKYGFLKLVLILIGAHRKQIFYICTFQSTNSNVTYTSNTTTRDGDSCAILLERITPQRHISIEFHVMIVDRQRRRRHHQSLSHIRHQSMHPKRFLIVIIIHKPRLIRAAGLGRLRRGLPNVLSTRRRRNRQPPGGVGEVEASGPASQGDGSHVVSPGRHFGGGEGPEPDS